MGGCTALSVAKGLLTEPVLTLEIQGEECEFMVDTGAMVSLVQPGISKAQVHPCDVKARGVTGTQLDILGEQEVKFTLRNKDYFMTFEHTFIVSPLVRCSSGILGMDFLQRVGAEISLTSQMLTIGRRSFPLKGRQLEVSEIRRLTNAGLGESSDLDLEEGQDESVGDWEGTVELAETVTVPPLSVRIARCRVVVRRNASATFKVPRNQEILVDPGGLEIPGVYMARVVATLENKMSSSNAGGSYPLVVEKSPLEPLEILYSPCNKHVAGSDGSAFTTSCGDRKAGSGEHLPELPKGGLLAKTTGRREDLQAEDSSLPVENGIGTQVDTNCTKNIQRKEGPVKVDS